MIKLHSFRLLLSMLPLAAVGLTASHTASAQAVATPSFLNFQGRLTTPAGNPVPDGTYSILFSLHTASTGGTKLWERQVNGIAVRNGVFTAVLNVSTGFQNGATAATLFNGNVFLEIKIGSDTPLTPRQQILSVPYAKKADTVPDGSITGAKIAGGTITADKFAAGANAPGGTAGGDLIGTYPNPELRTQTSSLYKVSGTLMSALAGAGTNAVDQAQIQGGNTSLDSAWQSFTPSQNGSLTSLEIYIGTTTGVNRTIPLVLYSGEGVSGTEIARVTVTVTPGFGFQNFSFASPVPLVAGQKYTWYLGRSSSLQFGYALSDPYSGGRADLGATLDYAFRSYMTTGGGVASRIGVNAGMSLTGANILELGFGLTKEANAGKIGYQAFTADALDILGAGTTNANRKIKLWSEGGLTSTGSLFDITASDFSLRIFNPGNSDYPAASPPKQTAGLRLTYAADPNLTTGVGRSINVLAGMEENEIAPGVIGGTVAGGGSRFITSTAAFPNRVLANFGTVSGGRSNTASGFAATVPGGDSNAATGQGSFAAGVRAKANHNNAFVWNGNSGTDIPSTAAGQFLVYAPGNVGINKNNPAATLDVNGGLRADNAVFPNGLTAGGSTLLNTLNVSGILTGANASLSGSLSLASLTSNGLVAVDHNNQFNGTFASSGPVLRFGNAGSGEGIGSDRASGNNQQFGLTFYTSFQKRMILYNDGSVGIGSSISPSGANNLRVTGVVRATEFIESSDARYKTNITKFDHALETILGLRGVTYDWNREAFKEMSFEGGRQIGFLAQEVEKVLPELVRTDKQGYKSVAYSKMVPVLVEGIKTLNARLEDKQKQIDALNAKVSKVDALESKLAELTEAFAQLKAQQK